MNLHKYLWFIYKFSVFIRARKIVLTPSIEQRNQISIKLHDYINYYIENDEHIVKLYNCCKLAN